MELQACDPVRSRQRRSCRLRLGGGANVALDDAAGLSAARNGGRDRRPAHGPCAGRGARWAASWCLRGVASIG